MRPPSLGASASPPMGCPHAVLTKRAGRERACLAVRIVVTSTPIGGKPVNNKTMPPYLGDLLCRADSSVRPWVVAGVCRL